MTTKDNLFFFFLWCTQIIPIEKVYKYEWYLIHENSEDCESISKKCNYWYLRICSGTKEILAFSKLQHKTLVASN